MRIISWNANRSNRYDLLWSEPLVTQWNWDVICLQEAGKPAPEWGEPINQSAPFGTETSESCVCRFYRYQVSLPSSSPTVYIVHAEWPNRQKNHLVMITKAQPSWAADMSGGVGERPALAIKAVNVRQDGMKLTIQNLLIGTVHVVSSYKSAAEFKEMVRYIDSMAQLHQCSGWMVAGDYNCAPYTLVQASQASTYWDPARPIFSQAPAFPTHDSGAVLDYFTMSHDGTVGAGTWHRGTIKSDHYLVAYEETKPSTFKIM